MKTTLAIFVAFLTFVFSQPNVAAQSGFSFEMNGMTTYPFDGQGDIINLRITTREHRPWAVVRFDGDMISSGLFRSRFRGDGDWTEWRNIQHGIPKYVIANVIDNFGNAAHMQMAVIRNSCDDQDPEIPMAIFIGDAEEFHGEPDGTTQLGCP